jgi:hypothetical protein
MDVAVSIHHAVRAIMDEDQKMEGVDLPQEATPKETPHDRIRTMALKVVTEILMIDTTARRNRLRVGLVHQREARRCQLMK